MRRIRGTGTSRGSRFTSVQDAVMALLSQSLVPLRTGEIVEAVQREINIDRRTVERALGRLAQSGKLSRPKKGYYEIRRN